MSETLFYPHNRCQATGFYPRVWWLDVDGPIIAGFDLHVSKLQDLFYNTTQEKKKVNGITVPFTGELHEPRWKRLDRGVMNSKSAGFLYVYSSSKSCIGDDKLGISAWLHKFRTNLNSFLQKVGNAHCSTKNKRHYILTFKTREKMNNKKGANVEGRVNLIQSQYSFHIHDIFSIPGKYHFWLLH